MKIGVRCLNHSFWRWTTIKGPVSGSVTYAKRCFKRVKLNVAGKLPFHSIFWCFEMFFTAFKRIQLVVHAIHHHHHDPWYHAFFYPSLPWPTFLIPFFCCLDVVTTISFSSVPRRKLCYIYRKISYLPPCRPPAVYRGTTDFFLPRIAYMSGFGDRWLSWRRPCELSSAPQFTLCFQPQWYSWELLMAGSWVGDPQHIAQRWGWLIYRGFSWGGGLPPRNPGSRILIPWSRHWFFFGRAFDRSFDFFYRYPETLPQAPRFCTQFFSRGYIVGKPWDSYHKYSGFFPSKTMFAVFCSVWVVRENDVTLPHINWVLCNFSRCPPTFLCRWFFL